MSDYFDLAAQLARGHAQELTKTEPEKSEWRVVEPGKSEQSNPPSAVFFKRCGCCQRLWTQLPKLGAKQNQMGWWWDCQCGSTLLLRDEAGFAKLLETSRALREGVKKLARNEAAFSELLARAQPKKSTGV